MIVLQEISKFFGEAKAVDNISFEIKEGETLILLGTSGCGKTTTLKMINRLVEPSQGIIKVNDENILTQSPEKLRRNIGYVLQHHGLFPHYTIAENIEVVPSLLKWDNKKKQQRTKELLDKLHLPYDEFAKLYPSQLSGGQQQRVGVARALAADAPVLLMDEPFGALDPVTRSDIRTELMQLEEFKRKTIIMVTHDIQEAFIYGDRICLMDKGKIVQMGTPHELLFHPANEFVSGFLEEQRLQLEFKTISLQNVWEHLDGQQIIDETVTSSLNVHNSVWEAMEYLTGTSHHKKTELNIKNDEQNQIKQVNLNHVLQAFNTYKDLKHE